MGKQIAKNRRAFHDYEILESIEAGIELKGTEVKSIRQGNVNLKESFARIMNNELYLFNCHISVYSHGNINNHEPTRDRKLLLHRKEINKLIGKVHQKGLSLIPTAMYFKKNRVKVSLALGKGKKMHDKRESIKKKDVEREESRHKINM